MQGELWVALSRPGSGLGVTFGLCYHGRARDFELCYHGSVGCGEAVFRILCFEDGRGRRTGRDGRVGDPLTFFFSSSLCSAIFFSVGPQAIAKYLTYFAFSRIGEAGGRAARDGVGGPLTFFFSSSLCSAFFHKSTDGGFYF